MTDTTRRSRSLVRPMTNDHQIDATNDATKQTGRGPVEGMNR
jgi:hypothetical protein